MSSKAAITTLVLLATSALAAPAPRFGNSMNENVNVNSNTLGDGFGCGGYGCGGYGRGGYRHGGMNSNVNVNTNTLGYGGYRHHCYCDYGDDGCDCRRHHRTVKRSSYASPGSLGGGHGKFGGGARHDLGTRGGVINQNQNLNQGMSQGNHFGGRHRDHWSKYFRDHYYKAKRSAGDSVAKYNIAQGNNVVANDYNPTNTNNIADISRSSYNAQENNVAVAEGSPSAAPAKNQSAAADAGSVKNPSPTGENKDPVKPQDSASPQACSQNTPPCNGIIVDTGSIYAQTSPGGTLVNTGGGRRLSARADTINDAVGDA